MILFPTHTKVSFRFVHSCSELCRDDSLTVLRGRRATPSKFSTADRFEHGDFDFLNPTVSTSYRNTAFAKPNLTVLEAQARICTGPTKTRPLSEEQAFKVFDTILKSANGEVEDGEERVSEAQLGAFFCAMTIRANAFPEATQWSDGERRAASAFWPRLVRALPPHIGFIADPEGSLLGRQYIGGDAVEKALVGALRVVLAGDHLCFEEVQGILRHTLPLKPEAMNVKHSLVAALLIGQRMNLETDEELKAYCVAFDGSVPLAAVRSLTHYGEPYDGNTRFFKSTLFVAAVRACYNESSLLHGVDWMPPKGGVTDEQMLKFMGANTNLTPLQARCLLEDEGVGFAYVSQREARPALYSLIELREHIKKRPTLATAEKVQRLVKCGGRESMVSGFYHDGYERPLLTLMMGTGIRSGLVVKGEEGGLSMTTRHHSSSGRARLPVNYCSGFRSHDTRCERFNVEIDATEYGFTPTDTPRTGVSVSRNVELGLEALRGVRGPAYDRIVLNAGVVDHLLGCKGAEDASVAFCRAREVIDSGSSLVRLLNYVKASNTLKDA